MGTRNFIVTDCRHKYHATCMSEMSRQTNGYLKCALYNRYLHGATPEVRIDDRGIEIRPQSTCARYSKAALKVGVTTNI